jgi:hypothetical protein
MSSIYTRIYDSKHKYIKEEAERDKRRLEQALKAFGNTAYKKSTTREIAALEDYIEQLRDLIQELLAGYGLDELKNSLWRVELELSDAVSQVTKLKINQVKPKV